MLVSTYQKEKKKKTMLVSKNKVDRKILTYHQKNVYIYIFSYY